MGKDIQKEYVDVKRIGVRPNISSRILNAVPKVVGHIGRHRGLYGIGAGVAGATVLDRLHHRKMRRLANAIREEQLMNQTQKMNKVLDGVIEKGEKRERKRISRDIKQIKMRRRNNAKLRREGKLGSTKKLEHVLDGIVEKSLQSQLQRYARGSANTLRSNKYRNAMKEAKESLMQRSRKSAMTAGGGWDGKSKHKYWQNADPDIFRSAKYKTPQGKLPIVSHEMKDLFPTVKMFKISDAAAAGGAMLLRNKLRVRKAARERAMQTPNL